MRLRLYAFFSVFTLLLGCTETVEPGSNSRILTMGDSMMAWHGGFHKSISHRVEMALGEPVVDRSVIGARFMYGLPVSGAMGMKIGKQFKPGLWDWVVLNGGGNDLWFGCNCNRCDAKMDRLLSKDGRGGEIAQTVTDLRVTGARVIFVGYLRSPDMGSPIEHCKDDGDELERRIERMVAQDDGAYFLSLADLVPAGDRSFHSFDMIHPSIKASSIIGQKIAELIRRESRKE